MKKLGLLLLSATLLLTSCGGAFEKGEPIDSETYRELSTDAANNGKRFAVKGYPFIDGDITTGRGTDPQMGIFTQPFGEGKIIANLGIPYGKGRNKFYVPETFTLEDMVIYDNEGNELKPDQEMAFSFTVNLQTERERMKLRGKMHYYSSYEDIRIDKMQ